MKASLFQCLGDLIGSRCTRLLLLELHMYATPENKDQREKVGAKYMRPTHSKANGDASIIISTSMKMNFLFQSKAQSPHGVGCSQQKNNTLSLCRKELERDGACGCCVLVTVQMKLPCNCDLTKLKSLKCYGLAPAGCCFQTSFPAAVSLNGLKYISTLYRRVVYMRMQCIHSAC
ncbi:hypothetical protein GUJ93_ZPchr0011g27337 [Zizania palustris]|uniref:Uncharacterized protein n=1 Tax=Zizania palustris TaxID=103762 RepID=A0A8J5WJC4_ZIZPA|nr:hypothetical protein GUJ93_ZPchr0011g27337 [Zizania palustris]